jgi:hypothetical protein
MLGSGIAIAVDEVSCPRSNVGHLRRIGMFETLTLAEIHRQHAELLPARTVLSLFSTQGGGAGDRGSGGIGLNVLDIDVLGDQANSAADGAGGLAG